MTKVLDLSLILPKAGGYFLMATLVGFKHLRETSPEIIPLTKQRQVSEALLPFFLQ